MSTAYKPIQFFLITFLASWIPGFIAAYLSYQKGVAGPQLLFMLCGLLAPSITTLVMLTGSKNTALRKNFYERLRLEKINVHFLPIVLLTMPLVVFLATAISLLFGQSIDQLSLSRNFKIMNGQNILSILILVLAPILEELGWRGYGVDSLRSNFNLFTTSMLFAFLWALWHIPLFFINGYYQHELWTTSITYTANFFISVIPVTILMNWVYYKNNRSITAAILFHFMLNLFSVIFQTEQSTKCMITILLLMISVGLIIKDRKFFFTEQESL